MIETPQKDTLFTIVLSPRLGGWDEDDARRICHALISLGLITKFGFVAELQRADIGADGTGQHRKSIGPEATRVVLNLAAERDDLATKLRAAEETIAAGRECAEHWIDDGAGGTPEVYGLRILAILDKKEG